MLHHKHFDCNYGAMHVPLDYLFGTYAGSKQEVGLGWGTLSHCLASRSLRSGAVSPLGRRLTIPPYIRPVRNRIKSSKKTRHSSLIITFLISCDSWLESNEVDRIILKSPELAQLRRLDSTYLICSVWIESIVRWAKRWEDQPTRAQSSVTSLCLDQWDHWDGWAQWGCWCEN